MSDEKVIVKKIRVFPIEAVLDNAEGSQKANILKINAQGAILEVFTPSNRAQTVVNMKCTLPLTDVEFNEDCLIVKTYNQMIGEKNHKKQYLIEVHYKKLKVQNQNAINDFLTALETKMKKSQEAKPQKKDTSS